MSCFWIGALYGAIVGLAIALALIFITRRALGEVKP